MKILVLALPSGAGGEDGNLRQCVMDVIKDEIIGGNVLFNIDIKVQLGAFITY
jgi:hypothetical protein